MTREPIDFDIELSESAQNLQKMILQTIGFTMNVNFRGAGCSMENRVAMLNAASGFLASMILSDMGIAEELYKAKTIEQCAAVVVAVRKAAISAVKEEINS